MTTLVVAGCGGAMVLAAVRWLRVAQREHYLAGSVTRFSVRWWTAGPVASGLAVVAAAAAVLSWWRLEAGLVVAAVTAVGPPGLGVRGRTSPLAWTGRLRRLALGVGVLGLVAVIAGVVLHPAVTIGAALLVPLLVDLAVAALGPVERRLGRPWIEKAAAALRSSGAEVVAITGSYGKTSTKGYVAHLLAGVRRVVASPASFNNRMGLARAINENLGGTVDVFVAEMGTYGPGEIAELCEWIPPQVSVITAIGPVHLERFGSEERILTAKAEILAPGAAAVLNVDDPRLAVLAEAESPRRRVVRAGSDPDTAEVAVTPGGMVYFEGDVVGSAPGSVHPTNLACAIGVALVLGVPPERVADRLATLSEPPHRRTVARGGGGVQIIDDTFNSNPAGAEAALATLAGLEVPGRRVVVTPGMVELGDRQEAENRAFGQAAAVVADVVVVVAGTNRRALLEGLGNGQVEVKVVQTRDEAAEWVRANLGPDDAVLYENDLPDHYP